MLAKELAKLLMEHPESEIKIWDDCEESWVDVTDLITLTSTEDGTDSITFGSV